MRYESLFRVVSSFCCLKGGGGGGGGFDPEKIFESHSGEKNVLCLLGVREDAPPENFKKTVFRIG